MASFAASLQGCGGHELAGFYPEDAEMTRKCEDFLCGRYPGEHRHGRACPAIHVLPGTRLDVDARDKPGHDDLSSAPRRAWPPPPRVAPSAPRSPRGPGGPCP
uniref:Uncharacterized protein n=1 Tax=Bradyrhizobium ottawaense TaxID=931866 RepID=A0A2U8P808_9BRAD|nr:hypothetical protein CIT37_17980 [Bradyrhizobium ottawaense]